MKRFLAGDETVTEVIVEADDDKYKGSVETALQVFSFLNRRQNRQTSLKTLEIHLTTSNCRDRSDLKCYLANAFETTSLQHISSLVLSIHPGGGVRGNDDNILYGLAMSGIVVETLNVMVPLETHASVRFFSTFLENSRQYLKTLSIEPSCQTRNEAVRLVAALRSLSLETLCFKFGKKSGLLDPSSDHLILQAMSSMKSLNALTVYAKDFFDHDSLLKTLCHCTLPGLSSLSHMTIHADDDVFWRKDWACDYLSKFGREVGHALETHPSFYRFTLFWGGTPITTLESLVPAFQQCTHITLHSGFHPHYGGGETFSNSPEVNAKKVEPIVKMLQAAAPKLEDLDLRADNYIGWNTLENVASALQECKCLKKLVFRNDHWDCLPRKQRLRFPPPKYETAFVSIAKACPTLLSLDVKQSSASRVDYPRMHRVSKELAKNNLRLFLKDMVPDTLLPEILEKRSKAAELQADIETHRTLIFDILRNKAGVLIPSSYERE